MVHFRVTDFPTSVRIHQAAKPWKKNKKKNQKKPRTLYNTMEYLEDPEDDSNFENGKVTIKGLIYLFGHFMDTCDNIHLMSALVDGFGLLILHGLYIDEKLVSRLILLYFNPATEPEINQILSIFFETLIHQKKQECLESALIQTLTKTSEASSESSLHEVKIETVLNFIINATFPVYCKSGINIHNNMATSLFKWMNTNVTNRELLRVVSKEILVLEIYDDPQIRKGLQELADELLEMPMDLRTEKNIKSFKEIMQGNRPVEIEFSSVAPASRIDGELEEDAANDDPRNLSDNESSNINDEEKSDDFVDDNSLKNVECAGSSNEKSTSEMQNLIIEPTTTGKEVKNATKSVENGSKNARKRLSTSQESSDEISSPAKIPYHTSNEDSESSSNDIEGEVNVHNRPGNVNENASPSHESMRRRVRQRIISQQQQQNSPDIIAAAPSTLQDSGVRRRGRPKKTVAQISTSNSPTVVSGNSSVCTFINRKSGDKINQENARKARNIRSNEPIKKQLASQIATRLNKKADSKLQGKIANSKSIDPQQPPKSNKGTKSSSATAKISIRNSTSNVSAVRTQTRKALFNSASEPPVRKANTKVTKKITSPRKQKEAASKISSSLTTLDNRNHRTRRGLTKEFIANNVMTRKRSSMEGGKLLEKIDTLTTVRRKNSIGMDAVNEKSQITNKSKKIVPGKSAIPIRPRRIPERK